MADKKTTQAPKVTKKVQEVKTVEQLNDELAKLRTEHNESRKSHRSGELVNPHVLNTQRKHIARLLTALNASKSTAVKEEN
jgi:large subunit ribosomal protein L29